MRKNAALAAVLALLAGGLCEAATTSRLTGLVVGTDNAPVPGATVQLWSDVLIGGRQAATSDDDGRFAFNLLPPGHYTVRAELAGFVPSEIDARVALDRETHVQLIMVAVDFTGVVEVTAMAPVIDTTQVSGSGSYGEDFLRHAAVGIQGRDWLEWLLQTPGTSAPAGERTPMGVMKGSNPRVLGSTQSENVYLLDWLNVTDPYTSTFGTWLNYDAIHEVSIEKTGLDAEYGLALGGVINLVTKSGGNSFSGSVDIRYRDHNMNESGEHFDPDEDPSSLRAISAVLGGPVMQDRMWFFLAFGQRLEEVTPTGSPVAREIDRMDWIAKLTWQASDSNRAVFKVSGYPVDDSNFNAYSTIAADAGATQTSDVRIVQAELHSVLSDSLLLTLQAGISRGELDVFPTSADQDSPLWYNEDADLYFNNMYYFAGRPNAFLGVNKNLSNESERDQAQASLTWFVDDLAGRHEIKVGVGLQELDDAFVQSMPYEFEFWVYEVEPDGTGGHDEDGDGFTDHILYHYDDFYRNPINGSYSSELWSFFLQDSWRPLAGLTVKAGLRLDTAEHVNTRGTTVADFDKWQPRLGVAWDPVGDGKQVLRTSWGRSMHPGALTFITWTGWNGGGFYDEYLGYEWYCGERHWCDHDWLTAAYGEPYVTIDENGNEHFWYLETTGSRADGTPTLDTAGFGRLEAPWAEIFTIGVERELWAESSVEIEYVNKKTRDVIEDVSETNTWHWDASVPEPSYDDPGSWPALSGDRVFANVANAGRDYQAVITKLETRHESYYAKASYTWSKSRGGSSTESWLGYQSHPYDYYPTNYYNRYGYMPDDRRHVVKLAGYALLPWNLTLSLAYVWASAPTIDTLAACTDVTPAGLEDGGYDPQIYDYCFQGEHEWLDSSWPIFLEPRASDRGRASYNLDLGIAKAFHIGPTTLELNLSILNVSNSERASEYQDWEFQEPEHGEVTAWTQPRRYQVGVRIDF